MYIYAQTNIDANAPLDRIYAEIIMTNTAQRNVFGATKNFHI